ncbi:MAG TPA: tetratricopeptide repeat protein [Terriglobales bacterium]|nr:tetratricopeptide repeat protein [Terriglobales bacterium]
MKMQRFFAVSFVAALLFLSVPAFGVSKEIVQLQTQVQALQDQVARMQQSFDQSMGVMKNLIEQNTDTMNKLAGTLTQLQQTMQKQNADAGTRNDQLSGQIQTLNDSLDELKARLARVTKQLEDMQASQQNLQTQQQQQQQPQAPPPDVLYNNAVRDYNAGNMDLAKQEFGEYVKAYPNTDLAGNAQFYVAEMEYRAGNYQAAAQDYDKVLQQFPSGNKAASAQLKKGYSLIELGDKQGGVRELNSLVQRFPRSPEATQARERLRRLGVVPSTRTRRTPPAE